MRVTFIGCPFRTSYGHYIESLRRTLQTHYGEHVDWVASNCGCGDPVERERRFEAKPSAYFEMGHIGDYESHTAWKRVLRRGARNLTYQARTRRYVTLAGGSDVVHLQQTLNAYGAMVAFHWLRRPTPAAKVITVHEIDRHQAQFPHLNTLYNRADAVIVHGSELRTRLLEYGVEPARVHVLPYGTDLPESPDERERAGIVFYGGHHLLSGKGLDTLLRAAALLRERLGERAPLITLHGHYGTETPAEALELAERLGVADRLIWVNQIDDNDIAALYRTAQLAVLPYTGSAAGLPACAAAANGLPVIATRRAGIPDQLGECAAWIEPGDPAQLAAEIQRLLADPLARAALARRAYERAQAELSWTAVAGRTLELYRAALRARAGARS